MITCQSSLLHIRRIVSLREHSVQASLTLHIGLIGHLVGLICVLGSLKTKHDLVSLLIHANRTFLAETNALRTAHHTKLQISYE